MSTESQRYKRDIYMFVTWQHWSTEGTYLPLKKKPCKLSFCFKCNKH